MTVGRRVWKAFSLLLSVGIAAFWFVALRPQAIGGPAGYLVVSGTSMLPNLRNGDLVVVRRAREYRRGDVVAYHVPKGNVGAGADVIHRIVGGSAKRGFVVKGDNRTAPDTWRPHPGDIVGKLWVRIPSGERGLLVVRSPLLLASLAAGLALAWVVTGGRVRTA